MRYKIRWFLQKLFRGYSDPEVWDLQWHTAKYVLPRLKKLRKIRHGFPAMLCEEGKTEEESDKEDFMRNFIQVDPVRRAAAEEEADVIVGIETIEVEELVFDDDKVFHRKDSDGPTEILNISDLQ